MATRYLYITRHGDADSLGNLTDRGREQMRHLGSRLAAMPIDAVWHSPLPRAADSARELNVFLNGHVTVNPADELIDHVPYVPSGDEMAAAWVPFFDGYSAEEAQVGERIARSLTARFGEPAQRNGIDPEGDSHEILITHSYPIAWLVREVLGAPARRWIGLDSANAALTIIEHHTGMPANLIVFNDLGHLPIALRWTGFPEVDRP